LPDSTFDIELRHRSGALDLDVRFTLNPGWTALFAPSGAGKTTILRMIAGLDRPQSGRILVHPSRTLLDTATRTSVPPHQRQIRLVAQRPALFPHLSVMRNVRYGMASACPIPFETLLALCRITHLRDKHPAQLSGGERQRVALARALAAAPASLLLLDEPFTGLEAALRDEIIRDLRQHTNRGKIPVLLVTHDLGEVFAAEAHVLKMEAGRIVASGSAAEVLASERDRLIQRLAPSRDKDSADMEDNERI
jgi:molybdate transport system ATP-binding protein